MLSSVLLLLLISGAQASYYGVVYSYSVGDFQSGGYKETQDYRVSFSSCEELDSWFCGGDCSVHPVYLIEESRGEWCQKVYIGSRSSSLYTYSNVVSAPNWTENRNGIGLSTFELHLDLRNRSDINKAGSSPQTTIIPLVRVPSNCQRNINLLVSDPDGDDIRCRYAAFPECNICTPPSVLNVSSSCSLSFSPTNSSNEGPYAVQMMAQDFPRQTVTLTDRNGVQEVKTPSDAISKIPIQFVFRVDPAAPSCTEGEYLPRFLPPTPEHGAQISTNDSSGYQTLEIIVRAEATQAETTELLISGPPGVTKSSSGSGNFTLTWTPIASDRGLKKTLCFVVQANSSGSVYQSDLRCVFVTAGETATPFIPNMITTPLFSTTPPPTTTTANQPTTTTPPPTTTTTNQPTTTTTPPPTTTTTNQPTTTTTPPPTTTTTNQPTTTTTPPPTTTTANQPTTTTPPPTTTTANQPTTTTTPPASSIQNSTPVPGPYYVLALNAKISTSLSLATDSATIINLIKEELIRRGLPPDITLKLLSSGAVQVTTAAP